MSCREYDKYPYAPSSEYISRLAVESRDGEIFATLNDYLANTKGPALEIGGPTRSGFKVLENVDFPNKLIISNISPEDDDIANVDVMNLPFEDGSLGCIIASRLPLSLDDTDCVNEIRATMDVIDLLADEITNSRFDKLSDRDYINISPRIALIVEARSKLERNGLLVTKHLLDSELTLVKALGFDLLYHIGSANNLHEDDWRRGEYVFQYKGNDRMLGNISVKNCFCAVI